MHQELSIGCKRDALVEDPLSWQSMFAASGDHEKGTCKAARLSRSMSRRCRRICIAALPSSTCSSAASPPSSFAGAAS